MLERQVHDGYGYGDVHVAFSCYMVDTARIYMLDT